MLPHQLNWDYVYFDVLDTDRTAIRPDPNAKKMAIECALTGEAELKLAVLRGQIPVFPQTYGWDSNALLGFARMEGFEGVSFRWLIQEGYTRIRLRTSNKTFLLDD